MNGFPLLISAQAAAGPSLALPAPFWLLTILHWVTLALHFLAMNLLFGLLLIVLIAKKSPVRLLLFDTATKIFPAVMAATITLGVAPLLFTQVVYGEYFYAASIVSGWNWFLLIPVMLVVYYLLYIIAVKQRLSDKTRLMLLTIAAAGFVYISYTFTMISDLAEKPQLWQSLYQSSPSGASINPSYLQTIFRWAHIIVGGVAVSGIMIQWFALFHPKVKGDRYLLAFGGRVFLLAVLKATILALIYLFTLDKAVFNRFLLSPGLHAILGAIVINIIAVLVTIKAVKAENPKKSILAASVLVLLGIFCMIIARHYLRLVYLEGQLNPANLQTNPQWSAFAMFLITFVIGLVVLYWMLKKFFSSPEPT